MSKRVSKVGSRTEQRVSSWEETFKGFIFWKQAQGVSKTTLNDYRQHVTRFFTRYPDCWSEGHIKDSVIEYMADEIKPATFNLRLIYLKVFFEWCVGEGRLSQNPLNGFKKRKAQPRIVEVPENTLQRLLALPDQSTFAGLRDFALIIFTLDTGIRPKEALLLTVTDFDLERLSVIVPADVAKTRTTRVLPILPQTVEVIHKLINVRHSLWSNGNPVFCSNEGTSLTRHTWGDRLEMYSKQLGVKLFPYALRHCFAVMYLRNGGHAFALQKMLGHSDMSMTKRYVNLTGQDLQESHRNASPLNSLALPHKGGRVRIGNI